MDVRTGVIILGCATLVAGARIYERHNCRVEAELQERTEQIQQQEESRRMAALMEALKTQDARFFDAMAKRTAAAKARDASGLEESLRVSGTFEIVELSKRRAPWFLQLRSKTRGDLTVWLSEEGLSVDLAEAQRVISDAFHGGRKIAATVVCGKQKCLVNSVKFTEAEASVL